MNTDFKPLENESAIIENAGHALRQGKVKECRLLAEPVFRHYFKHNQTLSPALERLFGAYVAIAQGHTGARGLICDAPPATESPAPPVLSPPLPTDPNGAKLRS